MMLREDVAPVDEAPSWSEECEGMAAVFGDSFVLGESSASLKTAGGAVLTFFIDSRTMAVSCPRLTREQCALLVASCQHLSLFAAQDAVVAAIPPHEPKPAAVAARVEEPPVAWVQSAALRDRKSKFVGFAARCRTGEEARQFAAAVRQNDATHNVVAWRLEGGESERDDDGEAGAGDWLLEMLDREEWSGVAVVVARWFGGVKLGSDRFRHIAAVAREALHKL